MRHPGLTGRGSGLELTRQRCPDAVLIDEALRSFLLRHRAAELDAEYTAYDDNPLDEPDEWGDVATFRAAAGSS